MTENCKDLIKVLAVVADEENIYVTTKKSVFDVGAEIVEAFGDETASDYLGWILDETPQRMSHVLSNELSKSQRLQLANQIIKTINGDRDPSEVAKLIVEDRQKKTLALSALRDFIKDHTDFTIDKPSEDTCCIL